MLPFVQTLPDSPVSLTPEQLPQLWQRYRCNFMRYISAIARHAERQAMERLTARGYPKLAMNFSAPLSLLGGGPLRLTELAEALGVSKQLCLQSLKPIEQAGYIRRQADTQDKRAKLVVLTPRGKTLISDALEELQAVHRDYEDLIGAPRAETLARALRLASKALKVPGEHTHAGGPPPLTATISPLARTLQERLMRITADLGHPLQFSFAQVLTSIDLDGTPVAALAQLNGVTTQAISRIAGELESLGYIRRASSSHDRRSRKLLFTPRGLELLRDSVDSVQKLGAELAAAMGRKAFTQMEALSRALYDALQLERGMLGEFQPALAGQVLTGGGADTRPRLSRAAVLAYLAARLDPELASEAGGELRLNLEVLAGAAGLSSTAIEKQLERHCDTRLLEQLLRQLRAASGV